MLEHDSGITITRNSTNNKAKLGLASNSPISLHDITCKDLTCEDITCEDITSTSDLTCKRITCEDIRITNGKIKIGADTTSNLLRFWY